MTHTLTLIFLLLFSYCLTACKTPSLIESFSTQFGLMHFVKSVEFSGEDGSVEFDFTYRENDTMQVTCNFTIQSKSNEIYSLQRASFQSSNTMLLLDSLKLMFATRSANTARYTSLMTKDAFRTLFTGKSATFTVQGNKQTLRYNGGKSFEENAKAVRLDVLNLP